MARASAPTPACRHALRRHAAPAARHACPCRRHYVPSFDDVALCRYLLLFASIMPLPARYAWHRCGAILVAAVLAVYDKLT